MIEQIAHEYLEAGLSIFPIRCDGSKSPAVPTWNPYRSRFASLDEVQAWYGRGQSAKSGIGLVCGTQSGGLEVLDFDEQPDETFNAWRDELPATIRNRLCVCETGGLGYHVIYRCEEVCGNTKIAMTAAGGVLVESRGEGGYVVAVGSPLEVHASGSPYVQIGGDPLPAVPRFTTDERRTLWAAAAKFDERVDAHAEYVRKRAKELQPTQSEPTDPDTPWGDFNHRATWDQVLHPAGWKTSDGAKWTRPGKQFGTSAVLVQAQDGAQVLVVFSGSAGPLAPQGVAHRNWSKFGAYAALNHGGDLRAAAKAVRAMGFGNTARRQSA